jgi:hypothetical protein
MVYRKGNFIVFCVYISQSIRAGCHIAHPVWRTHVNKMNVDHTFPTISEDTYRSLVLERFSQYKNWNIGFRIPAGAEIFRPPPCQTSFGSHPASYLMGTGGFFLRVKRLRRQAAHSPPSIADLKNARCYNSTAPSSRNGD